MVGDFAEGVGGGEGNFNYVFNDIWSAGIAAELFSAETPLRALDAGV